MVSSRAPKADFAPGECVLCFEPDLSKARVLYDAKVLEVLTSKNSQGQRKFEYMVHFQGWNSSWDRVVPASFILKNTGRNRHLMKRLADIARCIKKNKSRMRRIDNILKEHFREHPRFDSDTSETNGSSEVDDVADDGDTEEADDDDDDDDDSSNSDDQDNNYRRNMKLQDSESEEEALPLECDEVKEVVIEIPENLKTKLEHDQMLINKKNKLIKLPAEPNVVTVLENYIKNFGISVLCATVEKQKPYTLREHHIELPEKNIDLCKEMMDGVRIFFDFALPTILLYNAEQKQLEMLLASKKPLVTLKAGAEESKPSLQSPKSLVCTRSQAASPSAEPPAKVPRSTPRGIKKELECSEDEDSQPRRITRKLFQEEVRRGNLKSLESPKGVGDGSEANEVPADAKQSRVCPASAGSEAKRASKSLRSRAKSEKTAKAVKEQPHRRLADRVTPPPPLLMPGSVSSSSSNIDTPTSSMEQAIFQHRESAVNEIFSWKMLPESEYQRVPAPPSLVYGAHHLLRLFVKLPQYMEKMPIPKIRLNAMIKHLELFLEYLSARANEIFTDDAYVEADESCGWVNT